MDAATLLRSSLNQQLHTVYDESVDGRRVRNDSETIAAREKQDALAERFAEWVWEEPDRARRLAESYNELFSSTVVPAHDGTHLSLPGLAASFTPHPHQRDAVARVLTDGRALLAHAVQKVTGSTGEAQNRVNISQRPDPGVRTETTAFLTRSGTLRFSNDGGGLIMVGRVESNWTNREI